MNLNDSFQAFLRSLENSEEIDRISLGREKMELQKADFLLADRSVICEIKRILEEPSGRINGFVQELSERNDWPIIFGAPRSFDRVTRNLHDKDILRQKFNERFSRSIEKSIQDANGQIRDTRRIFGLPDAKGILVLLNEDVHMLTPNVIAGRVISCLQKLDADRISPRFGYISQVVVIDKAHLQYEGENTFAFPIFGVENPLSPDRHSKDIADSLMREWPAFDGFEANHVEWGKFDQEFIAAREIRPE